LNRETKTYHQGAAQFRMWKATRTGRAISERLADPGGQNTGMAVQFCYGNREVPGRPAACKRVLLWFRLGKARSEAMMHDRGKSDYAIVAVDATNNAGEPAESGGPKGGDQRNAASKAHTGHRVRTRVTRRSHAYGKSSAKRREGRRSQRVFHHLSVDYSGGVPRAQARLGPGRAG